MNIKIMLFNKQRNILKISIIYILLNYIQLSKRKKHFMVLCVCGFMKF